MSVEVKLWTGQD